ncbi:frataxin homolog, mitochondrial isoform X2 [Culicoides brevitarsis]|uniref:frataxin homolog, mitochondrial isoform X2 n=1 Tax=Culicoides brevitarsis TaxID=469753 RepID=UPI00307C808C
MLLSSFRVARIHFQRCQSQKITKSIRNVSAIAVQKPLDYRNPQKFPQKQVVRSISNPLPPSNNLDEALVDANTYEIVCNETLESLCDYFDEIVESNSSLKDADIIYGDGVLTVKLGSQKGTYVINRQSPNRQIWLSSPLSGPKRYDFIPKNAETGDKCRGYWIYKHDGVTLHELLQEELPKLINSETNFLELSHGKR